MIHNFTKVTWFLSLHFYPLRYSALFALMQENREYNNKKGSKKFTVQKEKLGFRITRKLSELDSRHISSLCLLSPWT